MVKIQQFNQKVRSSIKRPKIKAGDIVKIHRKIKEGDKERIQVFEGIVISVKGSQSSSPMATVRRVSFGTGVEITVPVYSPAISKIEILKNAKVRRSKLYYLRQKGMKISKLKMKELAPFVAEEEEIVMEAAEDVEEKTEEKEPEKAEATKKDEKKEEVEAKKE